MPVFSYAGGQILRPANRGQADAVVILPPFSNWSRTAPTECLGPRLTLGDIYTAGWSGPISARPIPSSGSPSPTGSSRLPPGKRIARTVTASPPPTAVTCRASAPVPSPAASAGPTLSCRPGQAPTRGDSSGRSSRVTWPLCSRRCGSRTPTPRPSSLPLPRPAVANQRGHVNTKLFREGFDRAQPWVFAPAPFDPRHQGKTQARGASHTPQAAGYCRPPVAALSKIR